MIKLIVLGQELEVEGEFGFGLNYNIDDVKDPSKRNGNYSKSITLAGTKKANKLLGNLYDINSDFTFFNPNIRTPAKIVVNSTTVMSGYMRLISVDKSFHSSTDGNNVSYKVNIQSDTSDFFAEIKDRKLEDLSYSDFNHVLSKANIEDSWSHTPKDVYVYPLLKNTQNIYTCTDFKPAIFHKAYLKRIAIEAGYTVSGGLMDDSTEEGAAYAKDIIPFNGESLGLSDAVIESKRFQASQTVDELVCSVTIASGNMNPTQCRGDFDFINDDTTGTNFNNGDYLPTLSKFESDGSSNCNFIMPHKVQIEVSSPSTNVLMSNSAFRYRVYLKIDGVRQVAVSNGVFNTPDLNAANSYSSNTTFNVGGYAPNISTLNADRVSFEYECYNQTSVNLNGVSIDITIKDTVLSNEVNGSQVLEGDDLLMSNAIPKDVKQTDLITDLIKRYNAYIYVNPDNEKDIVFDTRDGFYGSGNTLDWTNKKDYSKKDTIKLLSELQSKELEFTYTSDKDALNTQYSDSVGGDIFGVNKVEFQNDFVKGTKKIQTPFAPTPLVGNSPSASAIVSSIDKDSPNNKIRVLHYGGMKNCLPTKLWVFEYLTSFTTPSYATQAYSTYPYAGHLDDPINPTLDLNFGLNEFSFYDELENSTTANLYNRFWKNYVEQINEGKLLTCYFNLNEVDIHKVKNNMNNKIFVKDSYYYINKIVDYNPVVKGVTKVELLKIKDGIKFVTESIKQPVNYNKAEIYSVIYKDEKGNYSESANVTFNGSNNYVGANSDNSVVFGNGNYIASDVPNGFIIGANNKEVTIAGGGFVGETEYLNGKPVALPNYKTLSLNITQNEAETPTAVELNNTINEYYFFQYVSTGTYRLIFPDGFTQAKAVAVNNLNTGTTDILTVLIDDPNVILINTRNNSGTLTDGILENSFVEIRFYD